MGLKLTFFADLLKAKETFSIILAEVKAVYGGQAYLHEKVGAKTMHPV